MNRSEEGSDRLSLRVVLGSFLLTLVTHVVRHATGEAGSRGRTTVKGRVEAVHFPFLSLLSCEVE